jgi:hypothetical protein
MTTHEPQRPCATIISSFLFLLMFRRWRVLWNGFGWRVVDKRRREF